MIAKFFIALCLFGLASAGGWAGLGYSGLGYGLGYGYGAGYGYGHGYGLGGLSHGYKYLPTYTAPIIKTIAPSYHYSPATSLSAYSTYQVHPTPLYHKSYVSPYYGDYTHGGYGGLYGGYGYGGKYWW